MAPAEEKNARLVYSTAQDGTCPACRKRLDRCRCLPTTTRSTGDGVVRVGRATQGRRGKGVTVISGLPLDDGQLRQLAKRFKQQCGTGGTVKDGTIEIQGDHRELLVSELQGLGFTVKRAGG